MIAGLRITPYAKIESLRSTRVGAHELWLNTVLVGAQAAYLLGAYVELSARAWHAVPLSEPHGSVSALEPSLSLQLAGARLLFGAIVVLADDRASDESFGLHVVASAGC